MIHALALVEPRRFERRELPFPEIGDDDGRLRLEAVKAWSCPTRKTDHVLGTVLYPVIPRGAGPATTEFKIDYLAAVMIGVLVMAQKN